jgi:Glycosyl hydrolase family 65, N-terminal domain
MMARVADTRTTTIVTVRKPARKSASGGSNRVLQTPARLDCVKMESLLEPTHDPAWVLAKQGYDPVREELYEARFAVSNGSLGVRGGRAVSHGSRWIEPQRTYIAGLFDIPGPEHPIPGLVAAPG